MCWSIKKLVQSQRIDEMKVFGGTLIARVMGSDTELELFDNFCVKYVGAIDKIFSSLSKKIRSMINLHCLRFPTCPVPSMDYIESARHS